MYAVQQLPNLTTIFQNELRSIDGDVYRLQIAFLNSIPSCCQFARHRLRAIYKYPGDSDDAGWRSRCCRAIENNETVLVVATVDLPGPASRSARAASIQRRIPLRLGHDAHNRHPEPLSRRAAARIGRRSVGISS